MKKIHLFLLLLVLASAVGFHHVNASGDSTNAGEGHSNDATLRELGAAPKQRMGAFVLSGGWWNTPWTVSVLPGLGNYYNANIQLSTNATVTPDVVPTDAAGVNVSTSTNFKGTLEGDPTTGIVRVTDAHPAGVYAVTVKAFDSFGATSTKTFTLTVTTPATCLPVAFAAATDFSAGSGLRSVAVGDFNGDGKQDLATANFDSNTVSVLLGDGAGGFSAATNFGVGSGPFSVAVGDFNGDGKPDFVTANFSSNNLSVRLGNGAGGFSSATTFSVGSNPPSVAVGDFNGDGKQDLVTANYSSNTMSVLLGDGAGSFGSAAGFVGVNGPYSVAVGDFDGDGHQDFVVTNQNSNYVTVFLGDGLGSFYDGIKYIVGSIGVSVAVGDFNGDGKQDLAVANFGSSNLSILMGDGLGSFGAATNFNLGSQPQSVAVCDFDSDGIQDLALASSSNNVSVMLGNGSGSFGAVTAFSAGGFPRLVAIGDFNGDGRQDFATANFDSNSVSVLLRQCAVNPDSNHPPTAMCQSITVPANGSCQASITPSMVDNGSFDPDAGDSIASRTLNSSGPFGLGPHTVTLTVTDTHGATNSCVATVTVVDTTKPIISCPANITVSASSSGGAAVTYPAPSASDNCGTPAVSCSVASGSVFPIGDTTVTCRATDAATNFAECTFKVHVSGGAAAQVADLIALIDSFNLKKGVDKKFDHKLNEVLQALNGNKTSDACNKLASLIKDADKESAKKLSPVESAQIIAAANRIRVTVPCLSGFVDMHTHPVSQLAFGEQLFFGGNDGDPNIALGSCNCYHNFVVLPFAGSCPLQNLYRNIMVAGIDPHTPGPAFPNFIEWPKYNSLLHQQMWIDWIRSAKEGGLRVMVALAVNSHTIADAAETTGANDDYASMNKQLTAMRALFSRHTDFAEIAYTSADLRRIVGQGKLAVILGIEMDNIGNFYNPADGKGASYNPNPSDAQIKSEIDRLFNLGVRYIFPIHITNNIFGGTALYESSFNVANKYNTGAPFVPEVVSSAGGIEFKLQSPFQAIRQSFFGGLFMGLTGAVLPPAIMPDVPSNYPSYIPLPSLGQGDRNSQGLTPKGQMAIRYMMQKGMLIDIDHMSEKSADAALSMAASYDYPVNSGHNDFRGPGAKALGIGAGNENARTDDQVRKIYALGGILGLGHGGGATNYVTHYRYGLSLTDGQPLAIGTDVNGFFALPGPPKVGETISPSFPKTVTGLRVWDFNLDGMAHYGLFPAFIESMKRVGMTTEEQAAFFSSAERFAQMWEKCDSSRTNVH